MIVGHQDIECCYLMPNEGETISGILSDDYYQVLIKQQAPKLQRRRDKIVKYLEYCYDNI